jgi:PilZ domain
MRLRASSRDSSTEFVPNSGRIYRISSTNAFCCCKLLIVLYILFYRFEGYRGCFQSKLTAVFGALAVPAFLETTRSWRSTLAMQPNSQDRRMMRRFDMRLPAIVRLDGKNEVHTETQNVSARGVFFYLDRAIEAGTKLEVTLTFPPHVTLTDAVRVRFTARVIRVEQPLPSARVGTAAMIEDYEFLRSGGSPDFLSALQSEWKSTD